MKKAFFLALILGCFCAAKAQDVSFIYNGVTYNDGDAITLYVSDRAPSFEDLYFKNNGAARTGDTVVLELQDTNGLWCWALCTGDLCKPGSVSAPFDMPANSTYEDFSFDLRWAANHDANASATYRLSLAGSTVTITFAIGTTGISEVASARQAVAFPNPAQGQVSIRYAVAQPSTLVVYDAQGRQVREMNVNGNGTAQFAELPAGIYAYGILGTQMQKLIVK